MCSRVSYKLITLVLGHQSAFVGSILVWITEESIHLLAPLTSYPGVLYNVAVF